MAWLRCTTCVRHLGWLFKLNLHSRHQHCTDEAQKAETVLSAVIYIYIYIYIYIFGVGISYIIHIYTNLFTRTFQVS